MVCGVLCFLSGCASPFICPASSQCHTAENYDKMLGHKVEAVSIDSSGGCFSNTDGLAGEEEMNSPVELRDKIYSKNGR